MMTREEVIGELIRLKKEYCDTGEPESTLWGHFGYEIDNGEVVWVEQDGEVVAFADFSWISSLKTEELRNALLGNKTEGGYILCVLTVVCTKPGLLWKLRSKLPKHRRIIGFHDDNIHYPRGIPEHEESLA